MPNGQKKIDIIGTQRPTVKFETYGKTTEIDLSTRTMKGFGQAFPDYFELFKAANLTNRIKYICRNKNITGNAFYISGGDITLDNAKIFSTDFDTEIMTGGRGGSLNKVSLVLEKFKNDYVEYLNHLAPRKELTPVTFDPNTKILTIGNEGKFSIVSAKEVA